jgi:signal transduction histidine kinase
MRLTLQVSDEFMRMTSEKENTIRNRSSEAAPLKWGETEPQRLPRANELTHLRKELLLSQKKLVQKSADLEKEKKERFQELGMVVHGLRNPASSILSAAEYLIDDAANALTQEQTTLLRAAAQSSLTILRMIDNVMDFSRFESGTLMMNITPADLVPLVKEVITLNRPQAERKTVLLEARFDSPALIVELDPIKITQVIDNLVSNAIKVSKAGSKVEIQICASKNFASVSVWDEGPGIPSEHMKTLFDPFQRGRDVHGFDRAETGLGLAMSKRIVELHHGSIDIQSQAGKGSVFTITLPMRVDTKRIPARPH